jgi:hypothetical protein
MHAELRKLAALLRKASEERESKKLVKCAQVIQAATALAILYRKIG